MSTPTWSLLAALGLVAGIAARCTAWYLTAEDPPRRACPNCCLAPRHKPLPVEPLIGRCLRCHAAMAPLALVPELLGVAGFLLAGYVGGGGLRIAAVCWLIALALPAVLVDAATQRLPDTLTWPCLTGVLVFLLGQSAADRSSATVVRTLLATGLVAAFFLLLAVLADVGLGDFKLAASLGAVLGYVSWSAAIAGIAAGLCLAGLHAAVLLTARRRRSTQLPLGPALLAGTVLVLWSTGR